MALALSGDGTVTGLAVGGLPDGTITNADLATKPVEATSVTNTAGQDWAGVAYTDPDAVGASPTAKIYPDGTVVGSTANGSYTKYPNGDLHIEKPGVATSSVAATSNTFPVAFINTAYKIDATYVGSSSTTFLIGKVFGTTVTGFNLGVLGRTSTGTSNTWYGSTNVNVVAKGRWK